MLSCIPE